MTNSLVSGSPRWVEPFRLRSRFQRAVGGRDTARMVVLLAAVLSLTSADQSTIAAVAGQLKAVFHIDNTDIGLLVTASSALGAVTALPFGMLADRVNRVRLLIGSITVWSLAIAAGAAAPNYVVLLASRVALGAVIASAGPVVASLTGDLFDPARRGRIFGFILSGELVGAGVGILGCGDLAAVWTWRASFAALAALGLLLAVALAAGLREPARGGADRLPPIDANNGDVPATSAAGRRDQEDEAPLSAEIRRAAIPPRERLVLHEDPARRSLWWSARYVLSTRTNVVLILASSLGYFFLSGMRTFGILFVKARFGLDQNLASLVLLAIGSGTLLGLMLSGRLADLGIVRHHLSARPIVAGAAFLLAGLAFLPGLLATSLPVAAPFLALATVGVGATNPALDAARLDIMQSRLWGRAESLRTLARSALEASAPLLFGYLSTREGEPAPVGDPNAHQPHGAIGLDHAFLIMLIPLFAAGLLLLVFARRTYPQDVATALASERAVPESPAATGADSMPVAVDEESP